jgi:hypothetical protein
VGPLRDSGRDLCPHGSSAEDLIVVDNARKRQGSVVLTPSSVTSSGGARDQLVGSRSPLACAEIPKTRRNESSP